MGLFGKIKNILFDEEEIEIPINDNGSKKKKNVEVETQSTKVEPTIEKEEVKEPLKVEEEPKVTNDNKYVSLFNDDDDFLDKKEDYKNKDEDLVPRFNEPESKKESNSFKFPMDVNDNDFNGNEMPTRQTKTNTVTVEKENHSNYDKYIITKKEETVVEKKFFKNSPIISPVYGIMDKNYKKDDIQEKPKKTPLTREQKKSAEVDAIRRKAFGTLEDDIDSTLDKSIDEFYSEKDTKTKVNNSIESLDDELTQPIKSIDELLIDSMASDETEKGKDKFEKASDLNETFKLDEVINEMKKTSNNLSTDDDLFKLIDSMYDERNDK